MGSEGKSCVLSLWQGPERAPGGVAAAVRNARRVPAGERAFTSYDP